MIGGKSINSNFGSTALCLCPATSSANHNNNHHQLLFHLIYLIFCCKKVFAHSGSVTVGIYLRTAPPSCPPLRFTHAASVRGMDGRLVQPALPRAEHLHKSSAIILRMQRHLGVTLCILFGREMGFSATRLFPRRCVPHTVN